MTQRHVFAVYDALAVMLLGGMLAALFSSCLPPQTCQPGTMTCEDNIPRVCSNTGRSWAISAPLVRCNEVGGVCEMRNGIAACLRARDGGAE